MKFRILRVAEGALQHLFEHPRAALRLVFQNVERFVGKLAANQVGQRTHLAGADAGEAMNGFEWHFAPDYLDGGGALAAAAAASDFFVLPPWPLKVRVGENSPRRCPTMSSVTNTFT